MPADGQGQGRIWIMQHTGRWTGAGQDMDRTACWQLDRGRAADCSYSIPADGQGQDSRWIIQHAGRWTGAGQEIVQAVVGQIDN
jgi:hypothetical protein